MSTNIKITQKWLQHNYRITEQRFYSESKNCDLLKEVVTDEVFRNISFMYAPDEKLKQRYN